MTKMLTNLDLNRNQLLNAVVQNLAVAPADANVGQVFFDTTTNKLKVFDGSKWVSLDGSDTAVTSNDIETVATNKATDSLNQAKAYADQEIAKLVGGATGEYDTLKELQDFITQNKADLSALSNVAKKYVVEIGDGVAREHTITHNLNTQNACVTLREANAPYTQIFADVEFTSANTLKVITAVPIQSNEKIVVTVVG